MYTEESCRTMDEVADGIVNAAMEAVSGYGYRDRYDILTEVSDRLQKAAEDALKDEYMLDEADVYIND